jgi:hypothetical protein
MAWTFLVPDVTFFQTAKGSALAKAHSVRIPIADSGLLMAMFTDAANKAYRMIHRPLIKTSFSESESG